MAIKTIRELTLEERNKICNSILEEVGDSECKCPFCYKGECYMRDHIYYLPKERLDQKIEFEEDSEGNITLKEWESKLHVFHKKLDLPWDKIYVKEKK